MNDNANMARRYEHEIPEGYEARIEGGKVIIELKESEDERIRKSLLEFLDDVWHMGKNANFDRWGKADCADWMSYLERQKEQKHLSNFVVDAAFDAREPRDNWEYIKEFCDKFGRMPKDMDELDALVSYVIDKKQKEQKSIISAEESLGISQEEYSKIVDECIYGEDKEQKATDWNEEDEKTRKELIKFVKDNTTTYIRSGAETQMNFVTFLESLPGRFNPKPKREWSEKDEEMYERLVRCCTFTIQALNGSKQYEEALSWLTSTLKDLIPEGGV